MGSWHVCEDESQKYPDVTHVIGIIERSPCMWASSKQVSAERLNAVKERVCLQMVDFVLKGERLDRPMCDVKIARPAPGLTMACSCRRTLRCNPAREHPSRRISDLHNATSPGQ